MHLAGLAKLKVLGLGSLAGLTDAGVRGLAGIGQLGTLWITHNQRITDSSVTTLASLKTLERLVLTETAITREGLAQLRKALPKTNIEPRAE
jgi:hypothetical protein